MHFTHADTRATVAYKLLTSLFYTYIYRGYNIPAQYRDHI